MKAEVNIYDVLLPTNLAVSRMTQDDLCGLQNAIEQLRGCQSVHVATIHLTEQRNGNFFWRDEVRIFDLQGHPTAQRCYACTSRNNDDEQHLTVVLESACQNAQLVTLLRRF